VWEILEEKKELGRLTIQTTKTSGNDLDLYLLLLLLFPIFSSFIYCLFHWCSVHIIICHCLCSYIFDLVSESSTPQLLTSDSSCLISCCSRSQSRCSVLEHYINVCHNTTWPWESSHVLRSVIRISRGPWRTAAVEWVMIVVAGDIVVGCALEQIKCEKYIHKFGS